MPDSEWVAERYSGRGSVFGTIVQVIRQPPVEKRTHTSDLIDWFFCTLFILIGGFLIFFRFRKQLFIKDQATLARHAGETWMFYLPFGVVIIGVGLYCGWQAIRPNAGPIKVEIPPIRTLPPHPIMGLWEEKPGYAIELRNDGMLYAHDQSRPCVTCLGGYEVVDANIFLFHLEKPDFESIPGKLVPGQRATVSVEKKTERYSFLLHSDDLILTGEAGAIRRFKHKN